MCCRWPKAIHNLRLSLLQSYNWSKIKPDFVPKINTMLGICLFVCFFFKSRISYYRSNFDITFQKLESNRIHL